MVSFSILVFTMPCQLSDVFVDLRGWVTRSRRSDRVSRVSLEEHSNSVRAWLESDPRDPVIPAKPSNCVLSPRL